MNIIDKNSVIFVRDLDEITQKGNFLYIIDKTNSNFDLLNVIFGNDNYLEKICDFSRIYNATIVFVSNFYYDSASINVGALIFDKGIFLSMLEPYNENLKKEITVCDTFWGRIGLLFFNDIYQNNIFYFYESLGVDFLIIFCNELDLPYLYKITEDISCIFIERSNILFNNI